MADTATTDTEQEQDTDTTTERTETERTEETPDESGAALLKALREERTARRDAETRLKKIDAEKKRADTERAIKAGEWESVAKAKDGEIAERDARIAELEAAIADRDLSLVKARVAAKHRLPEKLIARLQGANEAELDADAKELAKLVASPKAPDTQVGGGQGGGRANQEEDLKRGLRATGRYAI